MQQQKTFSGKSHWCLLKIIGFSLPHSITHSCVLADNILTLNLWVTKIKYVFTCWKILIFFWAAISFFYAILGHLLSSFKWWMQIPSLMIILFKKALSSLWWWSSKLWHIHKLLSYFMSYLILSIPSCTYFIKAKSGMNDFMFNHS